MLAGAGARRVLRGASALPIGLLVPRRFQRLDALSQVVKLSLHLLMLKLIETPLQRINLRFRFRAALLTCPLPGNNVPVPYALPISNFTAS